MSGKWSQVGIPHKGWTNIDMEDLGEPDEICEMCEVQEIRYVHLMKHDDYPEILRVGCICAGNMELNYAGAKRRENAFKNARKRRQNWLHRKGWHQTRQGNQAIRTDGYSITIFQRPSCRWSGVITNLKTQEKTWARKNYATENEAKLAAFDGMIWLQERN